MNRENKTKLVADDLYKIPISRLKLNDFLKTGTSGIINIPYDGEGLKDGLHVVVSLSESDPYLYFYYAILQPSGEYKNFEYRVNLDVTQPRYGGRRYWYKCPMEILGCDRRTSVLYLVDGYLGCRRCYNLAYASSRLSGIYKKFGVVNMSELMKQAYSFKRLQYKDKSTKKLMRFNKKMDKAIALLNVFKEQGDARAKEFHEKYDKFSEGMVTSINGLTALNMPAGYTTGKLGNFITHILNIIDGLNKNENANISGSLDNSLSDCRPFLTIKVPTEYFHDQEGILPLYSIDSPNFKFWYKFRPDKQTEVILETRFRFTGTGSGITAKEITRFDDFARSLGFESENKLLNYKPGIFSGYAHINYDSGELHWIKAI